MSRHGAAPAEPYSPQRRTALVLTGTGTAGAYHAGVLKALHEAGIKLDVVAGHGIGAVGALFAAVDGGPRLWEEKGFWRHEQVPRFYEWRPTVRLVAGAAALSLMLVAVPIALVAAGLVVFPIDFFLKIIGIEAAGGLVSWYVTFAQAAFASTSLPTWLPRLVLFVLLVTAGILLTTSGLNRSDRRRRGAAWWRFVRAPLSTHVVVTHCWAVMWDLVKGAAPVAQPSSAELARRYIDLLSDNLGQPGFRELLVAVHDVDAHRDLVFGLVPAARRGDLLKRAPDDSTDDRQAEVHDLAGVAGTHIADAVAGALSIPVATGYHSLQFAQESFWRGETHRICDRPSAVLRLVEEAGHLDVTQVLLVSAAPQAPGPHSLDRLRLDPRGRLGEYVQSSEATIVRDVSRLLDGGRVRLFTIRPAHNPVGPFDFSGGFDDRSDRARSIAELVNRGYEDAYHQFIEPIVGASGERLGAKSRVRT